MAGKARGDSAVHVACAIGDIRFEIVKALVNASPATANLHATGDGATPLMRCCESNATELTKLLVEHGADVNDVDKEGHCVLHWALQASSSGLLFTADAHTTSTTAPALFSACAMCRSLVQDVFYALFR